MVRQEENNERKNLGRGRKIERTRVNEKREDLVSMLNYLHPIRFLPRAKKRRGVTHVDLCYDNMNYTPI